MRSIFIAGLLLVLLIAGILCIRNMETGTAEEAQKTEAIDRARETRDKAEKRAKDAAHQIEEATKGLTH